MIRFRFHTFLFSILSKERKERKIKRESVIDINATATTIMVTTTTTPSTRTRNMPILLLFLRMTLTLMMSMNLSITTTSAVLSTSSSLSLSSLSTSLSGNRRSIATTEELLSSLLSISSSREQELLQNEKQKQRRNQLQEQQFADQKEEYVNFMELLDPQNDTMVSNLIQTVLGYINGDGTAVNQLLNQFLPNNEGSIKFDIPGENGFELDLGMGSVVNLMSLGIGGLNTFDEINLLQPISMQPAATGNDTVVLDTPETIIQNNFSMKSLVFDLHLIETAVDETSNESTKNPVSIRLQFENVLMKALPIRLQLLITALRQFPIMGAILSYETLLMDCLQTIVEEFELIEFDLEFGTILPPTIIIDNNEATESISSDSPFFDIISSLFVMLPSSIPILFDKTIRGLVNDYLYDSFVGGADNNNKNNCPTYLTTDTTNKNNATTMEELVDFPQLFSTGIPAMVKTLIDDQLIAINPTSGIPKINNVLIEPFLNGGFMSFDGGGDDSDTDVQQNPLLEGGTRIQLGGLDADINFGIRSIQVNNLNTMILPMELLETLDDSNFDDKKNNENKYQLNNTMTMGLPIEDQPMSIAMNNLYFSIVTDHGSIENEVNMKMDVEAMNIIVTFLLKIIKTKLYTYPMQDVTNIQCWLSTIVTPTLDKYGYRTSTTNNNNGVTAGLSQLITSMKRMNLNITCADVDIANADGGFGIGCSSPGMKEMMELLDTDDAQTSVTQTMNDILQYGASLLVPSIDDNGNEYGTLLQTQIDHWLNDASIQCPHSINYNPNATRDGSAPTQYYEQWNGSASYDVSYLILWGSVLIALIAILLLIGFVTWCITRCRYRYWLKNKVTKNEREKLQQIQNKNDAFEDTLNKTTQSLFMTNGTIIPFYIRFGMPFIILGNIALFLSGHLNLGATVTIIVEFAGEVIQFDDFYHFSIARSTWDIWKAGGKELAILILIFSGIWPYTKQLITLVVWFLPPSLLSVSKRGSILLWVDYLSKWSMVDIFVLVICIAAFRVSIKSPNRVAFLPDDFYVIDMLIVPMWGLYANMIAQLVSQVSSHFIIHYHRQIVNNTTARTSSSSFAKVEVHEDTDNDYQSKSKLTTSSSSTANDIEGRDEERDIDSNKYLLRTHAFCRPNCGETKTLVVRNWVNYAMIFLVIALIGAVIAGCILPTFSIDTLGIIGVAVESGQQFEQAVYNHSVFSIIQMLFDEAKFLDTPGDYIGLTTLCILFVSTVLIVPIVQAMILIVQWFVPFTQTQRRRIWVLNEILQAWEYIQVYILSLFIASWQLGPVSQYLFNSYCGNLTVFFSQMVNYGILKNEDAQCFSVQGSIEPGSFTLVAAAILLTLLNSFVTKATKQYNYYEERVGASSSNDDDDEISTSVKNTNNITSSNDGDEMNVLSTSSRSNKQSTSLRPIPVMFTDTYRWLLRGGESMPLCSFLGNEEGPDATADGIVSVTEGNSKNSPVA